MKKFLFFFNYIFPVLLVAGIIFYLSSQSGLGDMENNSLEMVLRKGAHFMEYGLLSFLVWRLFYFGWRFALLPAFWFSLFLVVLYASTDERHQFFVVGRSGKMVDVLVDALSAFTVLQGITFLVSRQRKYLVGILSGFALFSLLVGAMFWNTLSQQQGSGLGERKDETRRTVDDNSLEPVEEGVLRNVLENVGEKIDKKEEENQELVETGKLPGDSSENLIDSPKQAEVQRAVLPKKVFHQVPFTTQSPFAKWDQLHEEACEEASLIMLAYFDRGKPLTKNIAEEEIQKLVKYQLKKYGDYYDTNMAQNKEIAKEYFGLNNVRIENNVTVDDLKRFLAEGSVILAPTAGRELHNPNFTAPGPLYHNLVIVGYDDEAVVDSAGRKANGVFITNDPGTRKGEGYKYDQQVLYKAIHDFPGEVEKILEGEKRVLMLGSEQQTGNKE